MDWLQYPWLRLHLQANGLTPTPVPTPVTKKVWLRFRLQLQLQENAWLRFRLRIAKNRSRLQAWLRLRSRNRPSLVHTKQNVGQSWSKLVILSDGAMLVTVVSHYFLDKIISHQSSQQTFYWVVKRQWRLTGFLLEHWKCTINSHGLLFFINIALHYGHLCLPVTNIRLPGRSGNHGKTLEFNFRKNWKAIDVIFFSLFPLISLLDIILLKHGSVTHSPPKETQYLVKGAFINYHQGGLLISGKVSAGILWPALSEGSGFYEGVRILRPPHLLIAPPGDN